MSDPTQSPEGRIIRQQPDGTFVGTGGLDVGFAMGQPVVVFELGEEIIDPDSGASLGRLEHAKGTLIAYHVQAKLVQLRPKEVDAAADSRVLSAVMADINAGQRGRRTRPMQVGDLFRAIQKN
jgi:hypothetical protein